MTDTAVELSNLHKDFLPSLTMKALLTFRWHRERIKALAGVTLSLQSSKIHALVGPNGAGKTTLLKVVAGLLLPTNGRACVLGYDTVSDPVKVRSLVGYCITDSRSFWLRLTGRENLRFFATLYGLHGNSRDERISEVLEELELTHAADNRVLTYSEGMKQRLGLARALVHRPRILLLDEVGRGLDPRLRAKVYTIVRDKLVAKDGVTVVMASHAMEEVASLADHVCVMDRGSVIATGTWNDVQTAVEGVFASEHIED